MTFSPLCDDCEEFVIWLLSGPSGKVDYHYPKDGPATIESAKQCRLCLTLMWYFGADGSHEVHDKVEKITLKVERNWDGLIAAVELTCYFNAKFFAQPRLQIWANEGDAAHTQGRFSAMSPLGQEGLEDTAALIKAWLARCELNHKGCRKTMALADVNEQLAPFQSDRMLDIANTTDNLVYLVKSVGLRGKYVCLSHCWGPESKKPMCVTQATESRFMEGVRVDELPKTFQQAVQLTRSLGVKYIWIDSLCIVQDNDEHWQQESARMGAIYEGAYLRLAAAGAHDSSGGLFCLYDDQSNGSGTITLPFKDSDGSITGKLYLRLGRRNNDDPSVGPLAQRAWAFQESRLARRTVSFMAPGISWACKTEYWNDRHCFPYDFHDVQSSWTTWEANVEGFSSGDITYESDRLVAIQGLANEFGKATKGQYQFGIWLEEGGLPKQLLWRIFDRKVGMQGLPDLPSWTWAKYRGSKQYLFHDFHLAPAEDQSGTRLIKVGDDGRVLTLKGDLKRCSISEQDVHGEAFVHRPPSPESMVVTHWSSLRRLLWADHGEQDLIGLIQLDVNGSYENLFYSVVLVANRWGNDPLRNRDEDISAEDDADSPWTVDGIPKDKYILGNPQTEEENIDGKDWEMIRKHGTGLRYYWILLLQPLGGEPDFFRRVGTGIVWSKGQGRDRPTERIFHLG